MKKLYIIILMLFSFTMSAQQAYNFEHHKIEYSQNLKAADVYTFYSYTGKIIAKETNPKDFALKLLTEDLKESQSGYDYYEMKVKCKPSVTTTKYFIVKSENTTIRMYVKVTRYFTYLDK